MASVILFCLLLGLLPSSHGTRPFDAQAHATRQLQEEKGFFSEYLSNEQLEIKMREISSSCGGIANVITWGKSVKGRDLLALELYAGTASVQYRPAFKYVGNIHGDEPSGRQLLLALGRHMCQLYTSRDEAAMQLLKTVSLLLIPTANPDGFENKHRGNNHEIDLNRNFPDPVRHKGHDLKWSLGHEQAETLAMMNLTLSRRFVGSLALHEGALVANYPFDGYADGSTGITGVRHATPDDATFVHLAKLYANLHTTMAASKEFPEGITNGAQWYPVYGGMQDWNYLAAGCMELTLELNDIKWPDMKRLAVMWEENVKAMVNFPAAMVLGGLRGYVYSVSKDGAKTPVVATIHVKEQGYNVTSAPAGDYYRPLAPGRFSVRVECPGHVTTVLEVTVGAGGKGVVMDVLLKPVADLRQGEPEEVVILVPDSRPGQLRGWHVMMYVLGAPLVAGVAYVLWRRNQGSKHVNLGIP